jgi:hypothetical protein
VTATNLVRLESSNAALANFGANGSVINRGLHQLTCSPALVTPLGPAGFRPFIPAASRLRELTPQALVIGTLLGIVFGASSLYLVLKVGLTVSASIPVAVISITLSRILSKVGAREATILEHNIVQTAGSAGESIAFGIGVTMPAILILGFDLELTRVMLVATLGGLLGILMMIPLRRALIVAQHGTLKYPEGTACAQVLKAGASAESRAAAATDAKQAEVVEQATAGGKTILSGFGIGFLYAALQSVFKTWKESPTKVFGAPFESASVSLENNPALLGVGYIIGPRIASTSCLISCSFRRSSISAEGWPRRLPPRRPTSSATWESRKFSPHTFCTSGPGPWPPAASSAWCVRCRSSGRGCEVGWRISAVRPRGPTPVRRARTRTCR